jgi:hypothetical protein
VPAAVRAGGAGGTPGRDGTRDHIIRRHIAIIRRYIAEVVGTTSAMSARTMSARKKGSTRQVGVDDLEKIVAQR